MVNCRVGGNEPGSGLTQPKNNKLLALLVLIRRSAEPNSSHKCAQIQGWIPFYFPPVMPECPALS